MNYDKLINWNELPENIKTIKLSFTEEKEIILNKIISVKQEYKIGDSGPAGGLIFYDKGTNDDGWRYLEAAPFDLPEKAEWFNKKNIKIDTKTRIGSGKENTREIIEAQGEGKYAAKLCADLTINIYTDWYLPSKEELNLMYTNLKKAGLGGFTDNNYWSSTENNDDYSYAWYQFFGVGDQDYNYKYLSYRVRAVRAFVV